MLRNSIQHLDPPLLSSLILLSGLSLVVLYSSGGEDPDLLLKQGIRIFVGFIILFAVAQLSPQTLLRWSPYIFSIGLILLSMVLLVGIVGKGAQRWLNLGLFRFQPAEIMKLGVPMMVAWVLTRNPLPLRWQDLFVVILIVAGPTVLVILQPDLGTALLIAAAGVLAIFLAGIGWRWIAVLTVAIGAAAPMLWTMLHDYQRRRVLTLFDPWSDPLGAGYHSIQSIIAVGSGGVNGKGWLNGSQSHLEFIPERSTDFIFAVFSEEFGFVGAALLIGLYVFIVGRGLYISFYAQDTFSRLIGGALSLTFFFYVFVNIGMVSGILPVVGVPLPLVSYGGTSMVTLMAGFGMLMSIHTHRKLMPQ
ncbi:MAG: rod shape-determining protein RodA [Arenicellales bacterium]|nr:rod shape-determining protein RodA [Arenicellales bacterium]